jgi:hypothetical protein
MPQQNHRQIIRRSVANSWNNGRRRASGWLCCWGASGGRHGSSLPAKGTITVKKLLALSVVCGLAIVGCENKPSGSVKTSSSQKTTTIETKDKGDGKTETKSEKTETKTEEKKDKDK